MAKLNNPADDEVHLRKHVANTVANLRKAEDYLNEHASDIRPGRMHKIEAENDRRKESLKGFATKINHETQS